MEQQKQDVVTGSLVENMLSIKNITSRCSGTGFSLFTGFYLVLTLTTGDREQQLAFHSYKCQSLISCGQCTLEISFSPFDLTVIPSSLLCLLLCSTSSEVKGTVRTNDCKTHFGLKIRPQSFTLTRRKICLKMTCCWVLIAFFYYQAQQFWLNEMPWNSLNEFLRLLCWCKFPK